MGGLEGGRMSLSCLFTCRGLHLCGSCLLMLLLLGLRGRLFLSSFAAGWKRSLRVSEDSSMYARFSPKKSSSWQPGEEAAMMGEEGGRAGWKEEGGGGAGVCSCLFSSASPHSSARISLSLCMFMFAALTSPSNILLTARQGWKPLSPKKKEETEETSDLESN